MNKLDEILIEYTKGVKLNPYAGALKKGTIREIKALMLKLIGDDEDYPTGDEIVEFSLNVAQETIRIDNQNAYKTIP